MEKLFQSNLLMYFLVQLAPVVSGKKTMKIVLKELKMLKKRIEIVLYLQQALLDYSKQELL